MTYPDYFYSAVKEQASKTPDQIIITVNGESITYRDCVDQALLIASALQKRGIKKEEKVIMILPNTVVWYTVFLAITSIGAIPVPLDPQIGKWELHNALEITEANCAFICNGFRVVNHCQNILSLNKSPELIITIDENCEQFKGIETLNSFITDDNNFQKLKSELLMLACTSGTTGNPKIISVEQKGFLKSQKDMANYLEITSDDIMLLGMPLYHQGGFGMGIQTVLNGGRVIYQEQLSPEDFLRTIEKEKVTIVQLTPTVARILLSSPGFKEHNLSSLRLSYFAGEKLTEDIAEQFYKNLNIPVVNIIGSTETATMVVWDSRKDEGKSPNIFKKLPFTDVKVISEDGESVKFNNSGEILIHTDAILLDYYKNENETKNRIVIDDNGKRWFKTGDLGKLIDNDTVELVGRKKRAIKRGSNLIHPEELESFLASHHAVVNCAILPEKDEIFGERVIAFIQQRELYDLKKGDILKFCRGNISAYKVPDEIYFVKNLPNNKGKINFKELKKEMEL